MTYSYAAYTLPDISYISAVKQLSTVANNFFLLILFPENINLHVALKLKRRNSN